MKQIVIIGNTASMMLNFRKELIQTLCQQGNKVYCVASGYTSEQIETLKLWGAEAIENPLDTKGLNPFKDIKAILKLRKIIKNISPDVVFSFFVKPCLFGSFAAKLANVPRIIGMVEGLGNPFTHYPQLITKKTKIIKSIQVFLYKTIIPFLDSFIVLNYDDKKDLLDKYHIKTKELTVLGGIGLDLDKFYYTKPNVSPLSFIFIARFLKEKGIFEYLNAAKIIKKKYPDIIFYILGEFDEKNPFALTRSQLEKYLKSNIVEYPGYVNNVDEWLKKASVFVLPSYYREGLPRSIQEAMAIGRPIITTDSVGCKETIKDDRNGFLIPVLNVDVLVEKMEFFINNPDKVLAMGLESRKIAEKEYNVHKVNKKLIKILLPD